MRIDKNKPQGGTLLVEEKDWCDLYEIQGTDIDVVFSECINKAFKRIVDVFEPKKDIAFVGLCTATRPFSVSRKWGVLSGLFSEAVDLIICSSGGIIPIEYDSQFPYLNYDAHSERKYDSIYIKKTTERMKLFFRENRYKYVLFNFRPNLRNVVSAKQAGDWLKENLLIEDYVILPNKAHYKAAQEAGFPRGKIFPELDTNTLQPVIDQIDEWSTK